jgi:hypothetical protein
MRPSAAYREPSEPIPVDGDVLLWGPAGVAFSMTADAAEETALRLLEAVRQARMQHAVGLEPGADH